MGNGEGILADKLGMEISVLFARVGLRLDILELRGHEIRPASFEESG
jgi:hypothetical protein